MIKGRYIPGNEDLSECFAVRQAVFIEEQKDTIESDQDGKDLYALHALVFDEDRSVGTARMFFESLDTLRIGRVCVIKDMRKQGVGDMLMRMLLLRALETDSEKVVVLSQLHAIPFYESLGFHVVSDEIIMDAGLEHKNMELSLAQFSLGHTCTHCGGCGKES